MLVNAASFRLNIKLIGIKLSFVAVCRVSKVMWRDHRRDLDVPEPWFLGCDDTLCNAEERKACRTRDSYSCRLLNITMSLIIYSHKGVVVSCTVRVWCTLRSLIRVHCVYAQSICIRFLFRLGSLICFKVFSILNTTVMALCVFYV